MVDVENPLIVLGVSNCCLEKVMNNIWPPRPDCYGSLPKVRYMPGKIRERRLITPKLDRQ